MAARRSPLLLSAVALPIALLAAPMAAQPVVQPLPPPAAGELSDALRRLARSPGDFDALIAAGRASLALGDIDAAAGFFARADAVRPGDARVKAGLATAYLKSERPIEALQMFEQAEAAGAPAAAIAADRGLAFDLVGDNVSAQAQYRLALSQGPNPEVTRRLGLSQAISGDRAGFEASLLPQLQRRDFAAYRVRAFGLAILGDEQEAVSIAEAVMPRNLSSQITPYLRYMPKLTRAQQAAAANMGAFPRAAQIGRDDPRFAQYAGTPRAQPAQGGDARLAPAGAPLGPKVAAARPSRAERRQAAAEQRQREQAEQQRARQAAARPQPTTTPAAAQPAARPPVVVARSDPPAAQPPVVIARAEPPASPPPVRTSPPPVTITLPPASPPSALPPSAPPSATATPAPSIELPAQPVVVAQLTTVADSAPATTAAPSITLPSAAPPEPANLADAFAEFAQAGAAQGPAAGAVDITAIKPKREVAEAAKPAAKPAAKTPPPPPPPPPKPKVPSRVWVQVATGKDPTALAFDWRRYGKKAPELLAKRQAYTAKWGETRRLLTGPFDSPRAAAKFVADLKTAGIESFTFTSEAGEEVTALK